MRWRRDRGDAGPARRSRSRADAQIAARKRAEQDGPPDHNTDPAYIELRSSDWKAAGELEQFNEDEDHWRELDQDDEDEPD